MFLAVELFMSIYYNLNIIGYSSRIFQSQRHIQNFLIAYNINIKNPFLTICHTSKIWHVFCFIHNGELAEWSNAPDSKSGSPLRARGFESHTQKIHSIIIEAVYTAFFYSNQFIDIFSSLSCTRYYYSCSLTRKNCAE